MKQRTTSKGTFILYAGIEDMVDLLTDEQKGILFAAVLDYVNGHLESEPEEPFTKGLFTTIRKDIEQNNEKYFKAGLMKSLKRRRAVALDKHKPESEIDRLDEKIEYLQDHTYERFMQKYPDEDPESSNSDKEPYEF